MSGGPLGSNPPSPPEGPPWCTCGCGEHMPQIWNKQTAKYENPTPEQRAKMALSLSNNSFALLHEKLAAEEKAAQVKLSDFPFLNEDPYATPEVVFGTATAVTLPVRNFSRPFRGKNAVVASGRAKIVTIAAKKA